MWCWRRLLGVPWTARRSNQSILKEISPEYSLKDWCWSCNSNTLATWCKKLTQKRPWCWARLKAGEEGDDRGCDGWMTSLNQWTWVWASFGSWRWAGKPGVLQSMGLQSVGHVWVTEHLHHQLCQLSDSFHYASFCSQWSSFLSLQSVSLTDIIVHLKSKVSIMKMYIFL